MQNGEMVPLTAEQSERLAELYAKHERRVVLYARRKLLNRGLAAGQADTLAEDIAQEAWLDAARSGARDVLRADVLEDDTVLPMMFVRVKSRITHHFLRPFAGEEPLDWQDPAVCSRFCPLLPSGCALVDLPPYLAAMVAELPDTEREALALALDGLTDKAMAERLGCSLATARRRVEGALLLLQIDNPQLSASPVPIESLDRWERLALDTVSAAQREVLTRLEELPRRALLLHISEGLGGPSVAARLGVSRWAVQPVLSACGTRMRALSAGDMETAA
ncbi:sigma factor-like helix-turn-helix DNA-binding protein [Streptomyces olivaceus]|uniref:sigma factor-like helix-turn-helix DNA-binding protein n=1 Tax=Streptomyces olivaceus TaxID=47716 RepID=UPI0033B27DBC